MQDIPIVKMADKPPARVPGHVMKIPSPPPSALPQFQPRVQLPRTLSEDEARKLDEECYERFIKVCAQYICEGFVSVIFFNTSFLAGHEISMQAVQHHAEEDRLGTVVLKLCEDCAKAVLSCCKTMKEVPDLCRHFVKVI